MKAIVATEKNWGIGKDGNLLIHLPGDLKFFKEETMGKVLIMGRKTLESLPGGRPLEGRTTIVLTRDENYRPAYMDKLDAEGQITLKSGKKVTPGRMILAGNYDELMTKLLVMEAMDGIDIEEDVMVAGGESIYDMFAPYCNEFIVTRIDKEIEADRFFPNLDDEVKSGKMQIAWGSAPQRDEVSGTEYRFVRYRRK